MLASTITPLPQPSLHGGNFTEDGNQISFGSMLVQALVSTNGQNDLEARCRAASILSHILKNNVQCKQRVLRIQLEIPISSLSTPELLMPCIVKYLAVTSPLTYKKEVPSNTVSDNNSMWLQPVLLRLLVTWLADCADAVNCFLDSPAHLTYMIELISSSGSAASVHVAGLAAVLLGECIVFNKETEDNKDAFMVVDAISQRIGLTAYFHIWEEMQKSSLFISAASASRLPKPLTRSTAAEAISVSDVQDRQQISDTAESGKSNIDPLLTSFYDAAFVNFIKHLEPVVREQIVELFSRPKSKVAIIPADLEQNDGESDSDYIVRIKSFVEKQCHEMQDLLGRNAALADDLAKTRGDSAFTTDSDSYIKGNDSKVQVINGISSRIEADNLRQELQESRNRIETLKAEKMKCEAEISSYKQLAGKYEADLKSLSDAYNSLEQANYRLELEVKSMRGGDVSTLPELEAIREEGRQEAQKESEVELNDLLVCLGQEQSKVEKLSSRLAELGEDIDALLEGIGEESEVRGDDEDENDDK